MPKFLQSTPARSGVGRSRQAGCLLAAAVTWLAASHAATAAERDQAPGPASVPSCLDELVDVFLSPLKREEGPPIRVFLKPGPPLVHLRLPRLRLRMEGPQSARPDTEDCGQKAFSGWRASYLRASDLAHGLGIFYDQPRVQDGQLFFSALDPDEWRPPVDDSGNREDMARKGAWIVDAAYQGPNLGAKFCVFASAPAELCYAHIENAMTYDTGDVRIYAQAFMAATFGLPQHAGKTQITLVDLDRYFTFTRRIADAVIVLK